MAKILVTMPDEFLHKIDGVANNEQRTRSELIREALRTYMKRINLPNPQKAESNAKILENLLS
ncbi:MAG: CopG family ribbon-helix-helix protein [Candidatus Gastranaerophilaceae bacterium]|nr:putative transcriptional regulator CopG family [Clostridium sp. CAG:967]